MAPQAEELGALLREATTDGPDPARRLNQRERLIREVPTPGPAKGRAWLWGLAALSAVALVVAALALFGRPAATPTEDRIAAAEPVPDEPLHIAFSDGSHVELIADARGHVATNRPDAVDVVLEAGRLEATVEPESHRQWVVHAGPFEVVVVGTVFAVDWDAKTETIEVEVSRGKVSVRGGPGLPDAGVAVAAGRRLRASVPTGTVNLTPGLEDGELALAEPLVPEPVEPEPTIETPPSPERARKKAPRPKPPAPSGPTWLSEAKAGNYKDALALAKAADYDKLVGSLGEGELAKLADVSRLAKDRARAKKAYLAVRERFPGGKAAGQAAFHLGRLQGSTAAGVRKAIEWFRAYLSERPKGAYVREAQGRLMQSLVAAGERGAATSVARRYLDRYPTGPHAKLAKSLVE